MLRKPVISGLPMLQREGVVRRYAAGLVMETAPSYRCSSLQGTGLGSIQGAGCQVLPGILARSLVLPHRSGPVALQQAVALLTGERAAAPAVTSVDGVARHAQRLLPGYAVNRSWEQAPAALLRQCLDAVWEGGLVLLLWRSIPRKLHKAAVCHCPPLCWKLVVGVEGAWSAPLGSARETASALLVLDTMVPPAWGSGHNQHLVAGAFSDHVEARRVGLSRAVWTSRTLDGGLDCGLVLSAVVLTPGRVNG